MDRLARCFDAVRERLGLQVYVPPSRQDDRNVYANNPEANRSFVDNVVITYKYTWCVRGRSWRRDEGWRALYARN